jgi:type I restriction enzyme R subunit
VATRHHDDIPEKLSGNENAMAYFGVLKPIFAERPLAAEVSESLAADTALAIDAILERHWKVQFWDDDDAQNMAINDIDDYLFDEVKGKMKVEMSEEQMNVLIEKAMQVAKSRSGR